MHAWFDLSLPSGHRARLRRLRRRRCAVFTAAVLLAATGPAARLGAAEAANVEEDRLRAALRQTTEQLRSAQSDLAALQGLQASGEQEKKDLQAKYTELKQRSETEKGSNDRTIASLRHDLEVKTAENRELTDQLAKTKTALNDSSALAKATGEERDRLKEETAAQKKRIVSLEAKNIALFMVGNEILTRYQDFGFGNALKAKEPFVGSTRSRLENLVQDYQDKLLDARDTP